MHSIDRSIDRFCKKKIKIMKLLLLQQQQPHQQRRRYVSFFVIIIILLIWTTIVSYYNNNNALFLYRSNNSVNNNNSSSNRNMKRVNAKINIKKFDESHHHHQQQQQQEQEEEEDVQQLSSMEPWDIIDQYISWHSHETLVKELLSTVTVTTADTTTTKKEHQQQIHNGRRFYSIGFYSCPQQLGNRLHHFMNTFLWSIITNRTLLHRYYTTDVCLKYGNSYDHRICYGANTQRECNLYLQQSKWIPSYNVFINTILRNTSSSNITQLSFWTTHSKYTKPGRGVVPYNEIKEIHDNSNDNDHHQQLQYKVDEVQHKQQYPIVVFPQMLGQYTTLSKTSIQKELLATKWSQRITQQLYKYGTDFLYGLLLETLFSSSSATNDDGDDTDERYDDEEEEDNTSGILGTLELFENTTAQIIPNNHNNNNGQGHDDNIDNNDNDKNDSTKNYDDDNLVVDDDGDDDLNFSSQCSIIVHSRHINATHLGDTITNEIQCIQDLWKQYYYNTLEMRRKKNSLHLKKDANNDNTTEEKDPVIECDLFIMTDRPHTIQALVNWCQEQPSSVSTTASNNNNNIEILFPCRRVVYAAKPKRLVPIVHSNTNATTPTIQRPTTSFIPEHGPYAGVGFLQDMNVMRQSAMTNIGIVGTKHRSSTDLLIEQIIYDRFVEQYYNDDNEEEEKNDTTNDDEKAERSTSTSSRIPTIPKCYLPI